MDAREALTKLKEGNRRFVENKPNQKDTDYNGTILIDGQQPYAVVVTCSDSRVAPEIIFDTSFNELFVIRNAGNVATDVELASVEYAISELKVPLILVIGHEKCGAVNAAYNIVSENAPCEGHFINIFDELKPSVEKHKGDCDATKKAEYDNARHTRQKILNSSIIKDFVDKGKVEVYCARYKIVSGEVEFL